MEPKPRLESQPRRPVDDDDRPDDADVDNDENRKWQEWIDDDSGEKRAPLPPVEQPEMGIHAPTLEMDEEDE